MSLTSVILPPLKSIPPLSRDKVPPINKVVPSNVKLASPLIRPAVPVAVSR
jgi:hypothetical protein